MASQSTNQVVIQPGQNQDSKLKQESFLEKQVQNSQSVGSQKIQFKSVQMPGNIQAHEAEDNSFISASKAEDASLLAYQSRSAGKVLQMEHYTSMKVGEERRTKVQEEESISSGTDEWIQAEKLALQRRRLELQREEQLQQVEELKLKEG